MWTNMPKKEEFLNVDDMTSTNKHVRSRTSASNTNECNPTICQYIKGFVISFVCSSVKSEDAFLQTSKPELARMRMNSGISIHTRAFVFQFKSINLLTLVHICSYLLLFVHLQWWTYLKGGSWITEHPV